MADTITTPEQMREAAVAAVQDMFKYRSDAVVFEAEMAIRAIPIAPQPVAVTVMPLVWEDLGNGNFRSQSIRGGEGVDRWTEPSVIGDDRVAYEAWGIDGVFDTPEEAQAAIEAEISAEILSALTIQPADPLSDPRVVALVGALKREPTLIWIIENTTQVRIRDLAMDILEQQRAALRAIGGEV